MNWVGQTVWGTSSPAPKATDMPAPCNAGTYRYFQKRGFVCTTQLGWAGSSCPKRVTGVLAVCIWSLLPWMQLLTLLPILGLAQVCWCRCCNTWCRSAQRNALPSSQGYLPEWEVVVAKATCLNFLTVLFSPFFLVLLWLWMFLNSF